ncbi:MAG: hypothetical protein K2X87_03570 [Gemmataceae bacterium]|nr:hypothetical protein [Gemmataceae bacterium]
MLPDLLFPYLLGYEDDGESIRMYVDGPAPEVSFTRDRGARTALFYWITGADAEAVRRWLAGHRAWQVLRVPPPYTPDRGGRAVRVAAAWAGGDDCPLRRFAASRRVADEDDRERAYREVGRLLQDVIENPVRAGEYQDLRLLAEVLLTAPAGAELAAPGRPPGGAVSSSP